MNSVICNGILLISTSDGKNVKASKIESHGYFFKSLNYSLATTLPEFLVKLM